MPETPILSPHPPEFSSVKQLFRRLDEDRTVSVDDWVVPAWQRSSVWSDEQQGLLALSILQGYPIGMIVLWDRGDGTKRLRVPVPPSRTSKTLAPCDVAPLRATYTTPSDAVARDSCHGDGNMMDDSIG